MRDGFFGADTTGEDTKSRARARRSVQSASWRLEPHVCRSCFSRVASTETDGDLREFVCTNCDLTAVGKRASCVCACGLSVPSSGLRGTKNGRRDLGLRCHENKARSPEFPALYVASYGGVQGDA